MIGCLATGFPSTPVGFDLYQSYRVGDEAFIQCLHYQSPSRLIGHRCVLIHVFNKRQDGNDPPVLMLIWYRLGGPAKRGPTQTIVLFPVPDPRNKIQNDDSEDPVP